MATTPGTDEQVAEQLARRLLRLFLNDTPELNRLIRKEESNDEKLDLALSKASKRPKGKLEKHLAGAGGGK